jgi:hypothetical protein
MPDVLDFDLAALEQIFESVPHVIANGVNGPVLEVTIGSQMRAAILANEDRFVRRFIVPRDSSTTGTLASD